MLLWASVCLAFRTINSNETKKVCEIVGKIKSQQKNSLFSSNISLWSQKWLCEKARMKLRLLYLTYENYTRIGFQNKAACTLELILWLRTYWLRQKIGWPFLVLTVPFGTCNVKKSLVGFNQHIDNNRHRCYTEQWDLGRRKVILINQDICNLDSIWAYN